MNVPGFFPSAFVKGEVIRLLPNDQLAVKILIPGADSYARQPDGTLGPIVYPEVVADIDRLYARNMSMNIDPDAVYQPGDSVCVYGARRLTNYTPNSIPGGRATLDHDYTHFVIGKNL